MFYFTQSVRALLKVTLSLYLQLASRLRTAWPTATRRRHAETCNSFAWVEDGQLCQLTKAASDWNLLMVATDHEMAYKGTCADGGLTYFIGDGNGKCKDEVATAVSVDGW